MPLLILGFAGEAGCGLLRALSIFVLMHSGILALSEFVVVSVAITVCSLLSTALVLLGLALVFGDVRRRMDKFRQQLADAEQPMRAATPGPDDLGRWRSKREGSRDITSLAPRRGSRRWRSGPRG